MFVKIKQIIIMTKGKLINQQREAISQKLTEIRLELAQMDVVCNERHRTLKAQEFTLIRKLNALKSNVREELRLPIYETNVKFLNFRLA